MSIYLHSDEIEPGDLAKNTHALDRCGLGPIVKIDQTALDDWRCGYFVQWLNPLKDKPSETWNSVRWLEKV